MKVQPSLCPICHGGHKQPGTTTFTVELGFGVIVVRDCTRSGLRFVRHRLVGR